MKHIAHERRRGDAPFTEELQRTVVLHDPVSRACLEVIHPALVDTLEESHTRMPELRREVGIAIHTRAVLDTIATHAVPQVTVHDIRRPSSPLPVAVLQVAEFFQQPLLFEGLDALAVVGGGNHALAEELPRLDQCRREEEHLVADGLYLVVERRIPAWQHIHIIVHEEHVVGGHERPQTVERVAHTDILRRVGVFQPFGLHPFQCAVAAIVHVYQQLVLIGRVLADTLHAEFQECQIIPRRNQYREKRLFHSLFNLLFFSMTFATRTN